MQYCRLILIALFILFGIDSVKSQDVVPPPNKEHPEPHLRNLKQLTFGGQNAEAYFSSDGSKLIFQSTRPPYQCDQIFSMAIDGSDVQILNTGKVEPLAAFSSPMARKLSMPRRI